MIVVHYLTDRQSDVNFLTKLNTEFYWRISRQKNGVDSGTRVTVFYGVDSGKRVTVFYDVEVARGSQYFMVWTVARGSQYFMV